MMVGSIPITALCNDSRVSYTLYIPPQHYNPDPSRQTSQNPANLDPKYLLPALALIVNVHGTSRHAEKCRDCLVEFANSERVAVLAPLFPAGLDGYTDLDSYKLLKSETLHSDLVLLQILDEVAAKWPGIETKKFFLMGFSGGGQFVHRFAYLHPDRLYAISVGAPGRVTFLDKSMKWPHGIQDVGEVFGYDLIVEKTKFRVIGEIQLVIGAEDNFIHGGSEFWTWLAMRKKQLKQEVEAEGTQSEKIESEQLTPPRKGRVDTLRELHEAWKGHNISSSLEIVPGVAHDSSGVQTKVEAFLRPLVRDLSNKRSELLGLK